ncbi:Enhancer of mRNA-decapping protein 3 [Portunus trituberculatus]|uniref:Enhancer of mRNA-decapping protein 3 n=1 Tax=Portunus trituberculatus TaxID=210409 RepID=A0A5B7GB01_PORTR|nr:Enhancer of mRNA-decapping protein 3 [Portunus trituberculatus]
MLQMLKKKKLREVSRHFGSLSEEQFDLGTFMVTFPEGDSERQDMTEEYVGCQVSVEVGGGLGFYQGKVVAINTQRQTLSLTQVIHNGRPAPLSEVTIK